MTLQAFFADLMNMLGTDRALTKALAAAGALALLVIYGMQVRHGLQRKRWATATALVLIAAVAVAGYFEFGHVRYGTFMNNHDFYHYYTGTKYAPEIGYHNQYAASLLADQEQKKVFDTRKAIRNLETHGYTATADVLAEREAIKGRFAPERWDDFKKDIAYFQDRVPPAKWQQMLRDKGYNGTPVWSMVTGTLTNLISTDNEEGMYFLLALDPIILGIMFLVIWWAFGPWTALFALAFFGTNFVTNFVHIKGALLRMDWVACLVISMCLLHKKHFRTAGVVLAYAAAARVFPAVFAFGVGALACWDLFSTRKINRDYVRFFASFFITAAVLLSASYLYYGSTLWQEFIAKIGVHNADISTTRVGFKYIFLWPFATFGDKVSGFQDHQSLWWKIQGVMLVITFIAARRMKPYQALGLGFVPAFFLTAPTFYYYILLIVPLMVFLPTPARPGHVLGAGLLFASSIAGYVLNQKMNLDFPLCFALSCMYGAICVYMVGLYLLPARMMQATGAAGAPTDTTTSTAGVAQPTMGDPLLPVGVAQPATATNTSTSSSVLARVLGTAYVAFILALFFMYRVPPEKASVPVAIVQTDTAPRPLAEPAPEPVDAPPATSPEPTPAKAESPAVAPQHEAPTISLAFVGDIMLSRNVERDLKARSLDFTYPFAATAPMLQAADIAFGNLECPISGQGEALDKRYIFNAPPESVQGLVFAGFDVVSLANNHILDYGPEAQEDTIRILAENGVAGPGITTGDEPQSPAILERNGLRVGFLAYADHESPYAYAKEYVPFPTGPAKARKESIVRDIVALKPTVDIIVVSIHWGIEYEKTPNERQVDLGHFVIDQGAHILAGHHPHVQQDAEWYNGGLIIYSLGNFVFDQWSKPATRESRLYTVSVTKDGPVHAQYRPLEIIQKDWQPRPTGPQYVRVPGGG